MAEKKKIILVTGGSGMVGAGLQYTVNNCPEFGKRPDEDWIFLSSKDGDLKSKKETAAIFEKYRPTHVIHLAAKVGGLYSNMKSPADFFVENMHINDNVLYTALENKVEKVVSILSTCIFPDGITYPMNEDTLHDGPPHKSNYGYASSKRVLDAMNNMYFTQEGLKWTSVVPGNVFGPNDNFNLEEGHMIPGMIHKVYNAKQSGKPLEIWGSGKPLRQNVYSRDLGKLLVWALRDYDQITTCIVATDLADEKSINEWADMIMKGMNYEGETKHLTDKADGQYQKTASNAKLRTYLPDFKFTRPEVAIRETVEWFVENYETLRK